LDKKGKTKQSHFESEQIGAITSYGTLPGPGDLRISAKTITVNENGFFFTGKIKKPGGGGFIDLSTKPEFFGLSLTDIQAAVILHELAHVADAIPKDGNDDNTSVENSQRVYDHCFKSDKKK
jgi:hypothetical protein